MKRTILVRTMHADDPSKDCWREVELAPYRPPVADKSAARPVSAPRIIPPVPRGVPAHAQR